jgi:predicted GH43/DUF377 family glycosyl hydrolase
MLRRRNYGFWENLQSEVQPHAQGHWCHTCGKLAGHIEIVEGMPGKDTHTKVLVRCHGAEELANYDMGSVEWDSEDLKRFIGRTKWFDPNALVEQAVFSMKAGK